MVPPSRGFPLSCLNQKERYLSHRGNLSNKNLLLPWLLTFNTIIIPISTTQVIAKKTAPATMPVNNDFKCGKISMGKVRLLHLKPTLSMVCTILNLGIWKRNSKYGICLITEMSVWLPEFLALCYRVSYCFLKCVDIFGKVHKKCPVCFRVLSFLKEIVTVFYDSFWDSKT